MSPIVKRALLMLAGAVIVLTSLSNIVTTTVAPETLPMPPATKGERSVMILTGIALAGAGVYLFMRGRRIKLR